MGHCEDGGADAGDLRPAVHRAFAGTGASRMRVSSPAACQRSSGARGAGRCSPLCTRLLNGVPKYVASRTLAGSLAWQGSTLVAEDLAENITALKGRHDEVHAIGSLDLLQSLLRFGLIDRMNLWVYPLLLGSGKQVFADGTVPTALRLTESVTYPNGTLHLAYETAGVPTYGSLAIEE